MKNTMILGAVLFATTTVLFSVIACGVVLGGIPRSLWFGKVTWSILLFVLWCGTSFSVGRLGAAFFNCTGPQRILAVSAGLSLVGVCFLLFGSRLSSLVDDIRSFIVPVSMVGLLFCGLFACFIPRQPTELCKWSTVAFLLQLLALTSYFVLPFYRFRPYVLATLCLGIPTSLYSVCAMCYNGSRVIRILSVFAIIIIAFFLSLS